MAEVGPYFEEHLAKIRDENLGRSDAWINREHNSRFNEWFKNRVTMSTDVPNEIVQLLGMGPSFEERWKGSIDFSHVRALGWAPRLRR